MLNRRHIRIKVMQILYAFKGSESDDLKITRASFNEAYEQAMYNLYLIRSHY